MTDQYLKPNPEALKKIKHIVVLMLENHSFDNMLGWLYDKDKPKYGQYFEGVNDDMWNPLNNIDSNGVPFVEQVYVRRNGEAPRKGPWAVRNKIKYEVDYCQPNPDPGEGFKDTNQQLFEYYDVPALYPPVPTNRGFVNNYANAMLYGIYSFGGTSTDPRNIMNCYTSEQTPVLSTLAKQFAVCDHWHCSVPSQTLPNRDFVHAATSNGFVNNHPHQYCDVKTVYQQIEEAIEKGRKDLSWGVYSGVNSDDKQFSLTRLIMTQLWDEKYDCNFKPIDQFYKDADAGHLPSYTFLEPTFSGPTQNDQHPPQDIRPGEKLIADVYEAMVKSPCWEESLLVITYDEHGGCFDHVAPGEATPPAGTHKKSKSHLPAYEQRDKEGNLIGPQYYDVPTGDDGFLFNRMGVRVPTVVVSPLIKEGLIARPDGYTPFDHTSIIATVRNCFDLEGPLTGRDAAAPDLSCLLTLDTPRKDKPTVKPLEYDHHYDEHENDLQQMAATLLAGLSGSERKKGESIHDYIHRVYGEHFVERK